MPGRKLRHYSLQLAQWILSLPRVEMAVGGENGDWVGILRILALDGANRCTSDSTDDDQFYSNHRCIFVLAAGVGYSTITTQSGDDRIGIVLDHLHHGASLEQGALESLEPYMAGEISQSVAMTKHLDLFALFEHTRQKDLALFVKISNSDRPTKR